MLAIYFFSNDLIPQPIAHYTTNYTQTHYSIL